MKSLTGKQRVRTYKPWFGSPVLVLQVEEGYEAYPGYGIRFNWRDATVEDLSESNNDPT